MKNLAVSAIYIALLASPAFAGIVDFDLKTHFPPNDGIWVFDVTLVADNPRGFNSADVVIGSNDGPVIVGFEYSQAWLDAVSITPPATVPAGIYLSDIFAGGFSTDALGPNILLGTVSVDVSGLFFTHELAIVSSVIDVGVSSLNLEGESEGLYGVAYIPEPTTLSLLAFCACGLIRSSRSRRIA